MYNTIIKVAKTGNRCLNIIRYLQQKVICDFRNGINTESILIKREETKANQSSNTIMYIWWLFLKQFKIKRIPMINIESEF